MALARDSVRMPKYHREEKTLQTRSWEAFVIQQGHAHPGNFILLERKYTNTAEVKHKINPNADDPFHIITEDPTIVAVHICNQVENISHNCVVKFSVVTESDPLKTSNEW